MSAFGEVLLPNQVELAIEGVFKTWMNTYLRELERRTARTAGALPAIRSWALMSEADERLLEQQLPGVQITWDTLGLVEHAETLSAELDLHVEVMVEAAGFDAVRSLAGVYAFALAMIVEQKLQKDPLIDGVTTPQLAQPALAPAGARRWRGVSTLDFAVTINDVMSTGTGPVDVAPDPTPVPPDYQTVQTADVTVITKAPQ